MNENIKAIFNKRKVKYISYTCKMLLIVFNVVLLGTVSNFYYMVKNMEAGKLGINTIIVAAETDPEMMKKLAMIIDVFSLLSIVSLIGGGVLLISLSLFWVKKIKEEYVLYNFLGYKVRHIKKLVLCDNIVEYLVAIPVAVIMTFGVWKLVTANELVRQLFDGASGWQNADVRVLLIVSGIVLAVAAAESVV